LLIPELIMLLLETAIFYLVREMYRLMPGIRISGKILILTCYPFKPGSEQNITGPDAFGAKTKGFIEGEFFGPNLNGVTQAGDLYGMNGFRLRHAFVKLSWTNTDLQIGQYWHPMFVTGCFPGTISFNTGAPFQPFSRNPQVRLTHKIGNVSIIGAVMSQTDFKNKTASLQQAGLPEGTYSTAIQHSGQRSRHRNTCRSRIRVQGAEAKTV
jgi:hypothetical protein